MTTQLHVNLDQPATDSQFLESCARLGDALTSLARQVGNWASGLGALNPPQSVLDQLRRVSDGITGAAAIAAQAAGAFEEEFEDARDVAARGMTITGQDQLTTNHPRHPGAAPAAGEQAMSIRYTAARAYRCPRGCKHPRYGNPVTAVIPEGAHLASACTVCGQSLVPSGDVLTGSWQTEPCCAPGPDGKWYGPRVIRARARSALAPGSTWFCTIWGAHLAGPRVFMAHPKEGEQTQHPG